MSMSKRAAKAIALDKKAFDFFTPSKDLVKGVATALILGSAGIGATAGALASKATSPTDVDLENARKEYKSNSLDAAIAELAVKLQNERSQAVKGTQTMQKAMRLV